jgi:hypothetical protein
LSKLAAVAKLVPSQARPWVAPVHVPEAFANEKATREPPAPTFIVPELEAVSNVADGVALAAPASEYIASPTRLLEAENVATTLPLVPVGTTAEAIKLAEVPAPVMVAATPPIVTELGFDPVFVKKQ